MKVPLISSDEALLEVVVEAFESLNRSAPATDSAVEGVNFSAIQLSEPAAAIEHINYQTPPLILINFSDPGFDGFEIMDRVVADPWLNNGSIIAFHEDNDTLQKINELENTNIIISLSYAEAEYLMQKVLKVIQENQQILFQRAIQSDLAANVSGSFLLDSDVLMIPCYANLIANYLYNMGFVEAKKKNRISLSLVELLINGIEHGNCGITAEEKTRYLEGHGTIHGLIEEKAREPAVAAKRVTFQFDIGRHESNYVITDEGPGFDWKEFVDTEREVDLLSSHGRGILLSLNAADAISYNDKGNEVRITVTHQQNTGNTVPFVFQDHETVNVEPGDVVFRQGENSDFLYYVAEGEFRVEVNHKRLATITPADILMGEMSFLLQETRSATVTADTRGRLIKVSNRAFIDSIKSQPYFGLFLAKLLAKRLYTLGRTIVN